MTTLQENRRLFEFCLWLFSALTLLGCLLPRLVGGTITTVTATPTEIYNAVIATTTPILLHGVGK